MWAHPVMWGIALLGSALGRRTLLGEIREISPKKCTVQVCGSQLVILPYYFTKSMFSRPQLCESFDGMCPLLLKLKFDKGNFKFVHR
jgi:hypothetical protein